MEGPFISKEKRGCHYEANIQNSVSKEKLLKCYGDDLQGVRIITLAPDVDGALETIKWLDEEYKHIQIAIG